MRYAVWNDGSKLVAGNLYDVRKVRDLLIPDGAVIVYAESEEEAIDKIAVLRQEKTEDIIMKNVSGQKQTLTEKGPIVSFEEYDQACTTFSQARALVRTIYDAMSTPSDIDKEALSWVLVMTLEKIDEVKDVLDRSYPERGEVKAV